MEPDPRPPQPAPPDRAAADPDAAGLPPNIILPDANVYRRDQLWGWVVSNAIGLALILSFWLFVPNRPRLFSFCAAVLGLSLLINLIRWALAAAAVRKKP